MAESHARAYADHLIGRVNAVRGVGKGMLWAEAIITFYPQHSTLEVHTKDILWTDEIAARYSVFLANRWALNFQITDSPIDR